MPLVADGQVSPVCSATRAISLHSWTLWAMSFSVMHVQAGLHGGDGRRGVQVQGQGDDHRLDAVLLGVVDQLLVVWS